MHLDHTCLGWSSRQFQPQPTMSPATLKYLKRHCPKPIGLIRRSALDVGSADITGECKHWLMGQGFDVLGVDTRWAPGVCEIVPKSCLWDLGRRFDLVVSLNTFEHVSKPWVLIKTLAGHLQPYGTLILVAPFSFQHHRHPVDCWRFAPDGMQSLAEEGGLTVIASYIDHEATATWGAASDIAWHSKRGQFREALGKIGQWWTRPPASHCVAVMRKGRL